MPKTGRDKVRIQLDLTSQSKRNLIRLAKQLNTNRSEAAALAFENAIQNEGLDPQQLARLETKLNEVLEWL